MKHISAMSGRRAFGGMVGAAVLAGAFRPVRAAPVPPADSLRFQVVRNGSVIGMHELRFVPSGDDLVVQIDVHMRVGFGPITFFRYHHQGEERWSKGQFVSLTTQTDHNGTLLRVDAKRVGDSVHVESTGATTQILPGTALPLTHWNIACMHQKLFNPEDGKVLADVGVKRGQDMVALADGRQVPATRFSLDGKAPIDDWYDENMVWTALRAPVKDGSVLTYLRVA